MQARVPIKGSLAFLDSRGTPHPVGIDVGQEQGDAGTAQPYRRGDAVDGDLEFRHGPRSLHTPGRTPVLLDRRIPVESFITAGTIEWHLDRVYGLTAQIESAKQSKAQPNLPGFQDGGS